MRKNLGELKFTEFHGIKLIVGQNTHPGSGPAQSHEDEYQTFTSKLDLLSNQVNPAMIEIGAFWGLWSLSFRQKFKNGSNILVECGSNQLEVCKENFVLNKHHGVFLHGGVGIHESGTRKHRVTDIEYIRNGQVGTLGPELNLGQELKHRQVNHLDVIHMDIQGSELVTLKSFVQEGLLELWNTELIYVGTHSARNHLGCKSLLERLDYSVEYELPTYGSLGHFVNRVYRKISRIEKKICDGPLLGKVIMFFEMLFGIAGQENGTGNDGLIIFYKRNI